MNASSKKSNSEHYLKRYSGDSYKYHQMIVSEMLGYKGHELGRVLDVGCGTGFLSDLLENYRGTEVIGIDIDDDMLSANSHKWLKASCEDIPFKDGYFDMVVCRGVLHHLEDPCKALKEMRRVLKPNGHFVCWEPNTTLLTRLTRRIFSDDHAKIRGVSTIVSRYFKVSYFKYGGFLGYALVGFPDILKFPSFITRFWKVLMRIDEGIPQWIMRYIGFYVMLKGTK